MRRRRIAMLAAALTLLGSQSATAPAQPDLAPRATAAKTVMFCFVNNSPAHVSKPRRCLVWLGGDPEPHGTNSFLARTLKWRGWGARVAKARGRFSKMGFTTRIRVRVSRRTECEDGTRAYRRIRITGPDIPGGTHMMPVPEFC